MNQLLGKWPGVVKTYDGGRRICTVEIPGITDGSTEFPEATLCTPIGDRAADTEIRILVGDPVWLEFEAGDQRFPIIVGYRTPREGNPVDWRRWRHANIEIKADTELILRGGDSSMRLTSAGVVITTTSYDLNQGTDPGWGGGV